MKVQPLPHPIKFIEIPFFFTPSNFEMLESCPLKIIAMRSYIHQLPPHPTVFLGQLLHIVATRWATRSSSENITWNALFDETEATFDKELEENHSTHGLVPLRRAIGRRVWKDRTRLAKSWRLGLRSKPVPVDLPKILSSPVGLLKCSGFPLEEKRKHTAKLPAGFEQEIVVPSLRLCGRLDWITEPKGNVVEVTDFKTGPIFDGDDSIRKEYRTQMYLYALMVGSVNPNVGIRLFLQQATRMEIDWDEASQEEIRARLETVMSFLPAHKKIKASSISVPGPHCANCQIRHCCEGYRGIAPQWWADKYPNSKRFTFDTWGNLIEVVSQGETDRIRIRDAAGRLVQVEGLSQQWELKKLEKGSLVNLYGLQPCEETHRGLQPRNFHEFPPGRRWSRAFGVQIFTGPLAQEK